MSHPAITEQSRFSFWGGFLRLILLWVLLALPQSTRAVAVDRELVLLVDVSNSGVSKSQFDSLLAGYSSAMSSSQVLASIQAGTHGRIAVSLMLYGGAGFQQVGIPWMSVANAADAAQFTSLATSLNKPNGTGKAGVGQAITAARNSFGTETGGVSNGFESTLQIIDIAAAVEPSPGNAAADLAARNGALLSGVDLINVLALGNKAADIAAYYSAHVIGTTLPGVVPSSTTSPVFSGSLNTVLSSQLGSSITAVPEPHAATGFMLAACLGLFCRQRRKS
jgi:hypothetical protein